jgi:hypothetical protein
MARNSFILLGAVALALGPVACVWTVDDGPGAFGGGNSSSSSSGASAGDSCNPVTAEGCPTDGSTCDIGPNGFFQCFPPPNTVDACGTCDNQTAFCGPELTCVFPSQNAGAGGCFHYCCTDADCGGGAICDTTFAATTLTPSNKADAIGLCVTNASTDVPSCATPSGTPSGGSCVGGYTPSTSSSSSSGSTGSSSSGGTGGAAGTGGGSTGNDGGADSDGSAPPSDAGPPGEDGGGFQGGWDGGHGGRWDGGNP